MAQRDQYSEMLQAYGQAYLSKILSPEKHKEYAQKVSTNTVNDSQMDKWEWCDCCNGMRPLVHVCH